MDVEKMRQERGPYGRLNPVSHEIRSEETISQIAITLHANI